MEITRTREKLGLDKRIVAECREFAKAIVDDVQRFIRERTTVTVERSILRLFGVEWFSSEQELPLANIIVNQLKDKNLLSRGATYWLVNALLSTGLDLRTLSEKIARNEVDITSLEPLPMETVRKKSLELATAQADLIARNVGTRNRLLSELGEGKAPYLYLIVATGNIYEDVIQAKNAARSGADIIAVIRSTAQSLLDYVPHGATTEGFGGTYATQENFRIMRSALDEVSHEIKKYVRLVNYSSGLCMPEIAAMGALERLDVMLNDSMYGILFRDINMQRTFVDQYFSRMINSYAEIVINTGEDNYLTTSDAYEKAHTVLASQMINERFAFKAILPARLQGLGHAFEIDPDLHNQFLFELAQAQMAREIFPEAPLKYMPPTKFMTGNVFKGHVQDALFNAVSVMTGQTIHLLGMLTEAIHTPFMMDRHLALENAKMVFDTLSGMGDELEFKEGGIIRNRACEVLSNARDLLGEISRKGLMKAISEGIFADIKRMPEGGKGFDGVVIKDSTYFNPFETIFAERLHAREGNIDE